MLTPLYRSMTQMGMATAAAIDWWLAGGIPAANVVEHVENPTQGQAYAGGTLSTAWSVSFRTNLASVPTIDSYAFDSATGRVIIGTNGTGPQNGFYISLNWRNVVLFATGDHTYMLISDGSQVQAYRDSVSVGIAIAGNMDIGGTTRWRSHNNTSSVWAAAMRSAHVANIALDATMRAGLHASMMALA
jgi:hypothetical protein